MHAGSLSHFHGLQGHFTTTEPLLMLLVTRAFPTSRNVCFEKVLHMELTYLNQMQPSLLLLTTVPVIGIC